MSADRNDAMPVEHRRATRARRRAVGRAGVVLGVATASFMVTLSQLWSAQAGTGRITTDVDAVAARPVAIVFGAGLEPDGRPSLALADRIDAAIALYRNGTVHHLLMSGDNRRPDYDEPTSMRRRALDAGVPAAAITLDFAGLDTFDTCARARRIFGVQAAVVVTQDFHVGRAVASCRGQGIDAVGLALPTRGFTPTDELALRLRERAATAKAFVDDASSASPHYAGPFVGLPGSATLPAINQAWDDALVAHR